ncbi:hypothetical protein [Planococcus halocryophilus]|uniref:hypothetical protein n=1 Tax=Planococcus halocryophilus TaxID=1215089 RepID=UPI001F0E36ED|nr:hypothetical protein [Planococcus halocryophilus]MCH4825548.1 hypothetical protein [Planococcus halocryophilus]
MSTTVFLITFIVFVIPLGIFLRFIDLGLPIFLAFKLTLIFPYKVTHVHYEIYKELKKEDRAKAIQILFTPITDLPKVIISIAEMYMDYHAKLAVIKELLNESDEKNINNHSKSFQIQGITFTIISEKIEIDETYSFYTYLNKLGFQSLSKLYKKIIDVNKEYI